MQHLRHFQKYSIYERTCGMWVDTDGAPIVIGQTTLTSKGTVPKEYQTPYGATTVYRHIYQSSKGGKTFCPLEREARIVTSATPRFAMQLAHKYAL